MDLRLTLWVLSYMKGNQIDTFSWNNTFSQLASSVISPIMTSSIITNDVFTQLHYKMHATLMSIWLDYWQPGIDWLSKMNRVLTAWRTSSGQTATLAERASNQTCSLWGRTQTQQWKVLKKSTTTGAQIVGRMMTKSCAKNQETNHCKQTHN